RPGTGALSAATFGVSTLALPLAATLFGHVPAGVLCLAAFLLLWWRRSPRWDFAAGLLAGFAVVVEYQAILICGVLLLYVLATRRAWQPAAWFVAGGVPPAIVLGVYDWAAFGGPFNLSYRYKYGLYSADQQKGLFGIGLPHWHAIRLTLFDSDRGLLVTSPVLVMAAVGLVLLWPRGRRGEAATCLGITLVFLIVEAGYFLPFGGTSPGPRFFAPALPFLALGFPLAYDRWPRLTGALAVASLVVLASLTVNWRID